MRRRKHASFPLTTPVRVRFLFFIVAGRENSDQHSEKQQQKQQHTPEKEETTASGGRGETYVHSKGWELENRKDI